MAQSKWPEVQEKLILVEGWARDGLTELQIAKNLGISKATMENYKRDHLDFLTSLKKGKEVVDREVENALFKRAMGYEYTETTFEATEVMGIDEATGSVQMVPGTKIKTVIKQVAPDVTAQIFWLKNRKPADWRDKRELDIDGGMVFEIIPAPKPKDEGDG